MGVLLHYHMLILGTNINFQINVMFQNSNSVFWVTLNVFPDVIIILPYKIWYRYNYNVVDSLKKYVRSSYRWICSLMSINPLLKTYNLFLFLNILILFIEIYDALTVKRNLWKCAEIKLYFASWRVYHIQLIRLKKKRLLC